MRPVEIRNLLYFCQLSQAIHYFSIKMHDRRARSCCLNSMHHNEILWGCLVTSNNPKGTQSKAVRPATACCLRWIMHIEQSEL